MAAGAGNGVEGGSRNRVRKPLPGAFEPVLVPPGGIGKHVGRDPAISVPPATHPSLAKKPIQCATNCQSRGVSQYLHTSNCLHIAKAKTALSTLLGGGEDFITFVGPLSL